MAIAPTVRQRHAGVWSVRHSVARRGYGCSECSYGIAAKETYWRYYGKMAESPQPWMARMCDRCQAIWTARYGDNPDG